MISENLEQVYTSGQHQFGVKYTNLVGSEWSWYERHAEQIYGSFDFPHTPHRQISWLNAVIENSRLSI
jgi:hypothetical protein